MRQLSPDALADLKRWEGCILYAYDDADPAQPRRAHLGGEATGTLTIGYGHTRDVKPGMRITQAEADRLLQVDLIPVQLAIDEVVQVPLTDGQYGALCSFGFNLGSSTAKGSPLANVAETLNRGDYPGAIQRMQLYNKRRRGGKLVPDEGLINRRAAEAGLWARGAAVASSGVEAHAMPPSVGAVLSGTGTGRAAMGISAAGVAGVVAQASPLLQNLGTLGPIVGVTLVLVVAGLFVLWRKGRL